MLWDPEWRLVVASATFCVVEGSRRALSVHESLRSDTEGVIDVQLEKMSDQGLIVSLGSQLGGVVCDMAHWQLSPGERAQRRARWRCREGNQPLPYGREVRPCYPLIPVYVWC